MNLRRGRGGRISIHWLRACVQPSHETLGAPKLHGVILQSASCFKDRFSIGIAIQDFVVDETPLQPNGINAIVGHGRYIIPGFEKILLIDAGGLEQRWLP